MSRSTLTLNVGAASTLSVTYRPAVASIKGVTWISDSSGIARVDPTGKVFGISPGTAVITAISDSGARIATCTVTVNIPVSSLTLPETRITLKVGDTYQLAPVIVPDDATNTGAVYSSSSTITATVASDGLITARRAGTTTITVKVDGKSAVCTVTVTK